MRTSRKNCPVLDAGKGSKRMTELETDRDDFSTYRQNGGEHERGDFPASTIGRTHRLRSKRFIGESIPRQGRGRLRADFPRSLSARRDVQVVGVPQSRTLHNFNVRRARPVIPRAKFHLSKSPRLPIDPIDMGIIRALLIEHCNSNEECDRSGMRSHHDKRRRRHQFSLKLCDSRSIL